MRLKRVLLASSALALLAGASTAQADGLYISVFGGGNWVSDSSASFFTRTTTTDATGLAWGSDADTGFVVGGAVGVGLDKWLNGLSVELEASYRRNDVGGRWSQTDYDTGPTPDFTTTGAINANLSNFAIMANAWYEHDFGWKIRPYVGGGIGWARANFDGALLTSSLTNSVTTWDLSNDGFAWQLGIGFNYQAAPGVDLGFGYRYFNGPDFSAPFTIDPFFGGGQAFGKLDNESHSVTVNLTIDVN